MYLPERFTSPTLRYEVVKLVRSSPLEVLDVPEALHYLLGDRLDGNMRRDLKVLSRKLCLTSQLMLLHYVKHLLLWAPVPPVIANTFFEPRYQSDPLILQYAHRVLEQHPVDLTFFFVPQVVQALRYDKLGEC